MASSVKALIATLIPSTTRLPSARTRSTTPLILASRWVSPLPSDSPLILRANNRPALSLMAFTATRRPTEGLPSRTVRRSTATFRPLMIQFPSESRPWKMPSNSVSLSCSNGRPRPISFSISRARRVPSFCSRAFTLTRWPSPGLPSVSVRPLTVTRVPLMIHRPVARSMPSKIPFNRVFSETSSSSPSSFSTSRASSDPSASTSAATSTASPTTSPA